MKNIILVRRFSLIALLVCLVASWSFAFDVSVKANVDNAQVFIGDMFNYEISVTAPENAIVDLPSFVGNLGSFEVKEMKNERITEGMPKGTAKFTWLATLNTFVGGDFMIAPQQVLAVVGSDTVRTNTDPVAVKVAPRTTGEEEDILEVEDPMADPRLPQWLYILLGVLGAILLVVAGWLLHKKLRKQGAAPRLPPYEEAVLALKELRVRNYLAEGNQGDYFMSMGFITRRYIERRFGVEILDATVAELKQRMAHVSGLPQAYKESVVTLAVETEPVKFAKMKLDGERCRFWDEWADRLVEDTKPTPEEQQAEKEALKAALANVKAAKKKSKKK
ncbi:hypothetical protein SAMN05720766_11915 [Fibrobacter sp. UWH9]|uniref:hypothetical protein n=1 Tax=unclassified Fibrobacter TaxID=2634177 RepID=UPI000917995A|nr:MULTISPECIES: hypothetical protein [Fibrobacter]MCL4102977.1 hypothetical protein [Fibrobacter succinogenes]SHH68405.1 hypothetical protein SAMN05720766_11915 [Fibrobacter sp. UWH9]SHL68594.1 hypothetical protein SAMN05720764_12050 [Fibrobacter sp. UWH5]